jgi:hypothetical protein
MKLEVKRSKFPMVAAVVMVAIMGPLALFSLYSGIVRQNLVGLLIGTALLVTLAAVLYLVSRGKSNSVTLFGDRGLTRGDLTELPWSNLDKVVDVMHTQQGQRRLWRTEIHFRDGRSAWVIPSKVSNYQEVRDYVDGLACEHVTT